MADSRSFALYSQLPIWAQNVACTIRGVGLVRERYNRTFHQALDFLEKSQTWSLAQLQEDQDIRVRRLITHAYDTVPYYREVMAARKLTPADIRGASDLPKLPILEKATLRRRHDDLRSRGWPARRIHHEHTGGTTGMAVHFDVDEDTRAWQWAVWWRHRRRFGMDLSQPFIVFAGRAVVPLAQREPPIWRRNLAMKQTYVSVHHMTRQNMPALVDYLDSREVSYYSGYPSALYLLAAYLLETGRTLQHSPRMTFTGAETVLPHQRDVIQRGLHTELADQYGASENCGNISECRQHRYHVDMEFGVIELEPIAGIPSETGSILCTGLHNYAMPLIRYAIGDVATRSSDPCSCGLQSPVFARIDGRIESYIVTPDGRQLGRLDFLFKDSLSIELAQLVQDAPDHVVLRIVRGPGYGPGDEGTLLREFRRYAGDDIRVDFEYLDGIPREANGKFRQIVSHTFRDPHKDGGLPG